MKKCLTFLLLLITLASTFFPCCLVDGCNDEEIALSQKKKQQPEGNCSPFFACATCAGFTELSKPIQIAQPVAESIIHFQAFVKQNLPTYSSSFWQPPRFC